MSAKPSSRIVRSVPDLTPPLVDVVVSRPTLTSAIARPKYPSQGQGQGQGQGAQRQHGRPTPDASALATQMRVRRAGGTGAHAGRSAPSLHKMSKTAALDLLVRGIWSLALSTGRAQSWQDEVWRRANFDPGRLLDLLMRVPQEAAFPYVSSPRLDGVGGGRRIADDGSPGIPAQWLRYFDRGDDTQAAAREPGWLPLVRAQQRMQAGHPLYWRVYSAHVLRGEGTRAMASALRIRDVRVRDWLRDARTLLLSYLAEETAEADAQEGAAIRASVRVWMSSGTADGQTTPGVEVEMEAHA